MCGHSRKWLCIFPPVWSNWFLPLLHPANQYTQLCIAVYHHRPFLKISVFILETWNRLFQKWNGQNVHKSIFGMGLDCELLVHPERLSSQLICPICTQILRNPVQTPTEHLFCEEELLEWMTISNLCPITKVQLIPQDIKKPSRIILNMLAELEVFCPNKVNGCRWSGFNENMDNHIAACDCKPAEDLKKDLADRDKKIQDLLSRLDKLELKCADLEEENKILKEVITENNRKLRVYSALADTRRSEADSNLSSEHGDQLDNNYYSDAIRLMRLKSLNSINKSRKWTQSPQLYILENQLLHFHRFNTFNFLYQRGSTSNVNYYWN